MSILFLLKKTLVMLTLFAAMIFALAAEEKKLPLGLELSASGSLELDSHLTNRFDVRLYGPLGFSLRAQLADKRLVPPWDHLDDGLSNFGAGLYHQPTGSRALYGNLTVNGLSKRIRNVWGHAAPYLEAHSLPSADLKTQAEKPGAESLYFQLASPRLGFFSAYLASHIAAGSLFAPPSGAAQKKAASMDAAETMAAADWLFGMNFDLGRSSSARVEGFFVQKQLESRKAGGWFSQTIYLPERDMRLYAFSLVWSNPIISFASDFAKSEVFAWGQDFYLNAALRIGNGSPFGLPWRLSLAADGAGSRYTASDGSVSGAGFRFAGKFEWFGYQAALVRIATTLRASAWEQPFDRSATTLYYHFPLRKERVFSPSRVRIGFERNAQKYEKIIDEFEAAFAANVGPFKPSLGMALKQWSASAPGGTIYPYPDLAADYNFDSLKLTAGLSVPIFFVSLSGSVGLTLKEEDDPVWSSSLSASAMFKYGRFSVRFNNPTGKPDKATWTFSWRLQGIIGSKQ